MRFSYLAAFVLVGSATASFAAAKSIDLSKPYGNKDGCANRVQQEYYAEHMLVLTDDALVTSTNACTLTKKTPQPDGSVVIKADCEAEGEETPTTLTYVVKRDPKNPKQLILSDDTGFVMGKLSLCK